MNDMENFLNFAAVVKIRRSYDDELFKFIQLMKSVGFLKEYAESFEKNCCYNKEFKEFSENEFWYYVKLNNGNIRDTCIEFQWGKGFTWGDGKDYLDYDSEMKILNIDELIKVCNKEELFKMNYENTSFENELNSKYDSQNLDNFLDFYEWSIVKYPNGKYNIRDTQCNTFDFEENTTFDNVLARVYFRMIDYFLEEDDIEGLIQDNEFEYVEKTFKSYIKTGESLQILDDEKKEQYTNWFQEIIKDNAEKDYNEISNDI